MRKVLVVDDERQIVKLIEINLRKAGYDVVCAYTGEEAVSKARAERPDAIVLDSDLPDMDGAQVLTALQSDRATQHIPVVTIGGPETGGEPLPSLRKPFNPCDVLDSVDRLALGWASGLGYAETRRRTRAAADMASYLVVAPPSCRADEIVAALKRAGCSVARATSLETALERAGRERPERVLLVGYGTQEADDLRRGLGREPALSHTPILVLTGEDAIRRFVSTLGR